MKIAIDIRCLARGGRTGVEEYILQLLYNIFEIDKDNEYILFLNAYKKIKLDLSWINKYPNVRLKKFHWPNKLLNFLFWYFNWPKIDRMVGGADVVFFPNIIFGSVSKKAKVVLTIHDLSFEKFPEYFSMKRRWWHIFVNPRRICIKSDNIISVSKSTSADIAKIYGIDNKKIQTIKNSIPEHFRVIDKNNKILLEVKDKYSLPFKFILFLGTIEPRKNIVGLIRAYDELQKFAEETDDEDLKKYKLVIAGTKGWLNESIFNEVRKSENKDKIMISGFIDDKDKTAIYNLASVFVYPSFYEGFGFPPLEAMSCGVPVITSNSSSLPEICNSSVLMIDPDKPEEIFESLKILLLNREFRENMIKKGIENAKKFSWKKSAKETLEILIGKNKNK